MQSRSSDKTTHIFTRIETWNVINGFVFETMRCEWPIFHWEHLHCCQRGPVTPLLTPTHHDHGAPPGGGDHLHHVHRGGQDPVAEAGEDAAAVHEVDVVRETHHQPGQADRDTGQ